MIVKSSCRRQSPCFRDFALCSPIMEKQRVSISNIGKSINRPLRDLHFLVTNFISSVIAVVVQVSLMKYEKTKVSRTVSTLQVLDVFSDRISFDIMNAISEKVTTSDNIRDLLGLTRKQFYTRHSWLVKRGLIKRKDTELTLTSFGQLIYQALLKIATAFRHSLELKTIDAVKLTAGIPDDELKNVIDKLIGDLGMKKLFC